MNSAIYNEMLSAYNQSTDYLLQLAVMIIYQ